MRYMRNTKAPGSILEARAYSEMRGVAVVIWGTVRKYTTVYGAHLSNVCHLRLTKGTPFALLREVAKKSVGTYSYGTGYRGTSTVTAQDITSRNHGPTSKAKRRRTTPNTGDTRNPEEKDASVVSETTLPHQKTTEIGGDRSCEANFRRVYTMQIVPNDGFETCLFGSFALFEVMAN